MTQYKAYVTFPLASFQKSACNDDLAEFLLLHTL